MTESEIEVSKEELRSYQKIKLITRIRELKDQQELFERKFNMNFI